MARIVSFAGLVASMALVMNCPFTPSTWVKRFEVTEHTSRGESAFVRGDGSIIVAARANPLDESDTKSLVLKLDSSGNEKWRFLSSDSKFQRFQKVMPNRFGPPVFSLVIDDNIDEIPAITRLGTRGHSPNTMPLDGILGDGVVYGAASTPDGGFLMGGAAGDRSNALAAFGVIIKVSHQGNIESADSYKEFESWRVVDIAPTRDGGFIVLHEEIHFGTAVAFRPALSKLNSEGRLIWHKHFDPFLLRRTWRPGKVIQAGNGGYIIVGETSDPNQNPSFDVDRIGFIRTDAFGNQVKRNVLKGVDSQNDFGSAVKSPGGGFVVAFRVRTFEYGIDMGLLHVNDELEPVWLKTYGTDETDTLNDVELAKGGGYLLVGGTFDSNGENFSLTVVRTDEQGNAPNLRTTITDIDSTGF